MRQSWKRIRWWLEYGTLCSVLLISRIVPRRVLCGMGRFLGLGVWHVLRYRRSVVLDNLHASFGHELSEGEIRDLARRFYIHLGLTLMEFLTFYGRPREEILNVVTVEGAEYLDACRQGGKGAIITSGHLGNWELGGAAIAALGYPVHFMIKSQSNPYVDRMQNEIRRRVGIGVIRQGAAARQLFYALRKGELVVMLADQDAGNEGMFMDFMGRTASLFRGPAYLAYRTGVPLVPCALLRQPDGTHVGSVTKPIEVDPNWDEETAVRELTRQHKEQLEAFIRRSPEQYFWIHRRWKTRPPAESP